MVSLAMSTSHCSAQSCSAFCGCNYLVQCTLYNQPVTERCRGIILVVSTSVLVIITNMYSTLSVKTRSENIEMVPIIYKMKILCLTE